MTNASAASTDLPSIAQALYDTVVTTVLMGQMTTAVIFEAGEAQNYVRRPADEDHERPYWEANTITFVSAGAEIPGTVVAETLPPNNTWVYSIYSSEPGPDGRNRFYGPPLQESDVSSGGVIIGARVVALLADMDAIAIAAAAAGSAAETLVAASAADDDLRASVSTTIHPRNRSQRRRSLR